MKKLVYLLLFLFISYKTFPLIAEGFGQSQLGQLFNDVSSHTKGSEEKKSNYSAAIDFFFEDLHQFLLMLNETIESIPKEKLPDPNTIEKPSLDVPVKQIFSIYNIELGYTKQDVEKIMGVEKRSSFNEYGLEWFAYHENYQNFVMIAFDQSNKVTGLYSNQDLISSTKGIKRGSTKEYVRNQLGEPLTRFDKEKVFMEFGKDEDFDIFKMKDSFVTIFYDVHQNNTVTSIQIISKKMENIKQDFFAEANPQLLEGFEYQLFDLTNATRVNHGLSILTWNDHVKYTARKHSSDMATNDYFDHKNLNGQSPFDRMQEDNVVFTFAGENLAYGQFSSIFAHEGLMNSMGHRENILRTEFEYLGVGVAFNSESQPYYTENFYAN